ncbi:MAG: DUF512 domain-containing protein [Clostridiales bacterium]|nr:DUF512 domain-containing protein [Clostridiales bacterium]
MSARIAHVEQDSLAELAGLAENDIILSINEIEIHDYLDYMYASCAESVNITYKRSGEDYEVIIDNDDFEPLGITFATLLIDEPMSCRNKCVFCFIDRNYVTMTNMTDDDVKRLVRYNIPRINISVHTTNPELRCKMLNNRFAGKINEYLKILADGGLNINAQIVLCPNYNDGAELDRTISDIAALGDSVESVSIVPVGLSDFRKGLADLTGFDPTSAAAVIEQVSKWQKKFRRERDTGLIYLSDEFYLKANIPFPDYSEYDGFPQIENGVGMCASLINEFDEACDGTAAELVPKRRKTIATGLAAYTVLKSLTDKLGGDMIKIIPIKNDFFGHNITVTGLLTGTDIINQLKGIDLGEELLLSSAMLRHGEQVLLDDMTVDDIRRELNIDITIVESDGYELLNAILA